VEIKRRLENNIKEDYANPLLLARLWNGTFPQLRVDWWWTIDGTKIPVEEKCSQI